MRIIIDLKDISDSREMPERKEPLKNWFIYILIATVCAAVVFSCIFKIDEYSLLCC